jgi:hypothetical protein
MCGACGRGVADDPVFPDGRTTRGNLIAAQMIVELCPSPAGRVKVRATAEGFVLSVPGGRQIVCTTVDAVWATLHTQAPVSGALLESAFDGLEERYRRAGEHRLLAAVAASGLRVVHTPREAVAGL